MSKEQIKNICFSETPDVRIRVINKTDTKETKQAKIKYPFELFNTVNVEITTNKRVFTFSLFNGYTWNGADIPKFFYRLIGSRTSNRFLIASMLHDYLLEFKKYIKECVLENKISASEYRRITSLVFREIIKSHGTPTIKANIMSWCVDIFQICNLKGWECIK